MPLRVLSSVDELDGIILERRLTVIAFTVCWSLGSKMILPTLFEQAADPNLLHVHFYRHDLNGDDRPFAQRFNIVRLHHC